MDQLPRLGKRELICLLLLTCSYVVSVWKGFLFLWVLGMGYVILLWHSLSLPYNYSVFLAFAILFQDKFAINKYLIFVMLLYFSPAVSPFKLFQTWTQLFWVRAPNQFFHIHSPSTIIFLKDVSCLYLISYRTW